VAPRPARSPPADPGPRAVLAAQQRPRSPTSLPPSAGCDASPHERPPGCQRHAAVGLSTPIRNMRSIGASQTWIQFRF
jgi:hypothetical protein